MHFTCVGFPPPRFRQPEVPSGFVCPLCKLKDLDPFMKMVSIGMAKLVEPRARHHVMSAAFTPVKYSENIRLNDWAEFRNSGGEMMLYCIKMSTDKSDAYKCSYPRTLYVRVNDRSALEVKEPVPERKRKDEPQSVSPYLKASSGNSFHFEWTCEPNVKHLLVLLDCRRETASSLEQHIRNRLQHPSLEQAQDRVRQLLTQKGDDEVELLDRDLSVKVLCPYTCVRINVPARGKDCEHLQCFDLHGFLDVTSRTFFNKRWQCPSCHHRLFLKTIVVDPLFQRMLKDNETQDAALVEFQQDGSWKISRGDEGGQSSDEESRGVGAAPRVKTEEGSAAGGHEDPRKLAAFQKHNPTVIDLDSDDEEEEGGGKEKEAERGPASSSSSSSSASSSSATAALASAPHRSDFRPAAVAPSSSASANCAAPAASSVVLVRAAPRRPAADDDEEPEPPPAPAGSGGPPSGQQQSGQQTEILHRQGVGRQEEGTLQQRQREGERVNGGWTEKERAALPANSLLSSHASRAEGERIPHGDDPSSSSCPSAVQAATRPPNPNSAVGSPPLLPHPNRGARLVFNPSTAERFRAQIQHQNPNRHPENPMHDPATAADALPPHLQNGTNSSSPLPLHLSPASDAERKRERGGDSRSPLASTPSQRSPSHQYRDADSMPRSPQPPLLMQERHREENGSTERDRDKERERPPWRMRNQGDQPIPQPSAVVTLSVHRGPPIPLPPSQQQGTGSKRALESSNSNPSQYPQRFHSKGSHPLSLVPRGAEGDGGRGVQDFVSGLNGHRQQQEDDNDDYGDGGIGAERHPKRHAGPDSIAAERRAAMTDGNLSPNPQPGNGRYGYGYGACPPHREGEGDSSYSGSSHIHPRGDGQNAHPPAGGHATGRGGPPGGHFYPPQPQTQTQYQQQSSMQIHGGRHAGGAPDTSEDVEMTGQRQRGSSEDPICIDD